MNCSTDQQQNKEKEDLRFFNPTSLCQLISALNFVCQENRVTHPAFVRKIIRTYFFRIAF